MRAGSEADFLAGFAGEVRTLSIRQPPAKRIAEPDVLARIDDAYRNRHRERNLEDSISLLQSLLSGQPNNPDLLWRLGRGLNAWGARQAGSDAKLQVFRKGEAALKASLAQRLNDAQAHFWLAYIYASQNEILRTLPLARAMRKELEDAISVDPRLGCAHRLLGELLRQLPPIVGGDKRKAVIELEEALRLSPNDTAAYTGLAEAYMAVNEKNKAIAVLKNITSVKAPDDPAEYENDLAKARELLKRLGAKGRRRRLSGGGPWARG